MLEMESEASALLEMLMLSRDSSGFEKASSRLPRSLLPDVFD